MEKKNIISFSLWSRETQLNPHHINQHKDVYTYGAIQNTILVKQFYPDWICRFYIDDSVNTDVIHKLKQNGAEIINMSGTKIPGMYWRFLVVDDKCVENAIIRDTDSRLNLRDKLVVEEFLNSDSNLHIIRDHPHHKYKILGGMWGIKLNGENYKMESSIINFLNRIKRPFRRMDDMMFLEEFIKNIPKHLSHDNYYYLNKFIGSKPFPDYNKSNEYYHYIGEYYDQYDKNPYYERDLKLISEFKFK